MSALTLAILSVCTLLTAVISAITGMAGGVLLLAIMTFFMTMDVIVPVHGIVQLASNSSRGLMMMKHVKRPILFAYCLGLPFGVLLSVYVAQQLSGPQLPFLLISLLIFYSLFKPSQMPGLAIPYWAFSIVGFFSGLLGILIGATGPLLAPFFIRKDLDRHEIIATKAALQLLLHLSKIPTFLFLGFNYLAYLWPIVILSICASLGTSYGIRLLDKMDDQLFNRIFRLTLFLSGLRMFYKAFYP